MRNYPILRACWLAVNLLLVVSFVAVVYSVGWEFSTRSYLRGFSDAIIPASDTSQQKVESILAWMAHGPARRSVSDPVGLAGRNPEDTLNIQQLLQVCGTATNAFVNLAESSGLHARRLLLLDQNRVSKHVVVEVLISDRWVVVDPSYHFMMTLPDGRLVTREELKNVAILRTATQSIPNYPPSYTYESTVHVRLSRIPLIGNHLRGILNFLWPQWEETINWTLLVERESFALLVLSTFFFVLALAGRLFLGWYCSQRMGITRDRLRDQILRVGQVWAGTPQ